ncbi:hypothetical protein FB451DRAFT_1184010 [Mycena latifolia]|nr:hypothetical protein FB451DRAFT_1184010 [Mycena latifolia]
MEAPLLSRLLCFFAAVPALAQTLVCPTPGQRLSIHGPFNVTYHSGRSNLEARPVPSLNISIVLSSAAGSFPGAQLAHDLAPTSYDLTSWYGSAVYSVLVRPVFLHSVQGAGDHTVHVLESYHPYQVRLSPTVSRAFIWIDSEANLVLVLAGPQRDGRAFCPGCVFRVRVHSMDRGGLPVTRYPYARPAVDFIAQMWEPKVNVLDNMGWNKIGSNPNRTELDAKFRFSKCPNISRLPQNFGSVNQGPERLKFVVLSCNNTIIVLRYQLAICFEIHRIALTELVFASGNIEVMIEKQAADAQIYDYI